MALKMLGALNRHMVGEIGKHTLIIRCVTKEKPARLCTLMIMVK